jgi:hypothetical protein
VLAVVALLLAILLMLVTGCSKHSGKGTGGSKLWLDLRNTDTFDCSVVVFGGPQTSPVYTVKAGEVLTVFMSPVPPGVSVVSNGGWPVHTRRWDPRPMAPGQVPVDYKGYLRVEVP